MVWLSRDGGEPVAIRCADLVVWWKGMPYPVWVHSELSSRRLPTPDEIDEARRFMGLHLVGGTWTADRIPPVAGANGVRVYRPKSAGSGGGRGNNN